MLIEVPVEVTDEANRAAANGMRLTIEHVNTSAMFNDNNLIKIMMMLRKCSLRKSRFNRHGKFARREEIHAV